MSLKKVNRIKEVKASDGFPVYEGKTSIQVTVNREEDAGCGKEKHKQLKFNVMVKAIEVDKKYILGDMKLKK